MTSNILLVDDEENNRNAIRRLFEDYDIDFVEAGNGKEALHQLTQHDIDLILLDIKMPVMDGFTFLRHHSDSKTRPKPPVCVMTAFDDADTRRKAIYLGADDFINKPIDPVELETRIASLLRISHQQRDLLTFNQNLEKTVEQRTQQLREAHEKLQQTERANNQAYREMIARISRLTQFNQSVSNIDPRKLGICTAALGWLCELPQDQAENLRLSAQLYNIGMLALPEKLRETPIEQLKKDELAVLSSHAKMGSDLFKGSDIPLLKQTYNICLYCQEHYDGTGLPNRVKSEAIPLESRLFTTAKLILETLHNDPQASIQRVKNTLQDHAGSLLDPVIVETILQSNDALENIIKELS
ncbi:MULTISPECIES: response regulator [unclassified Ketobacter]|uniref:response regulator n=1 Tax=unclassified Ketobacter TaxID=2639109 RepID=UPI000F11A4FF|nr:MULTISPECIES: response regulator [unclassified Ketobacter]RLT90694.1 MAG: response regulator [Ketobacter sp. GenoA1]RLT99792.1 MAG: response regulator [Ketobacter sp.]